MHGVRTNHGAHLAVLVGQLVATFVVGPASRRPLRSLRLKRDIRTRERLAIKRHTPVDGGDLRPSLTTTGDARLATILKQLSDVACHTLLNRQEDEKCRTNWQSTRPPLKPGVVDRQLVVPPGEPLVNSDDP